jgi:hypothetical protein
MLSDSEIAKFTDLLVVDKAVTTDWDSALRVDETRPVLRVGNINYYAVDHTPTLFGSAPLGNIELCSALSAIIAQNSDNKVF